MIFLKVQKVRPTATLPTKPYKTDAAFDLYSCTEDSQIVIQPGQVRAIPTGLAFDILDGYEVEIHSRSGLAKIGVFVANGPGTIDSGYTGEVQVLLYNSGATAYNIADGDRIAQIKVREVIETKIVEVKSIEDKERGDNGFGSTGK